MKCPTCGVRSYVIGSRDTDIGRRRRRTCETCGRFTTYEVDVSFVERLEEAEKEIERMRRELHARAQTPTWPTVSGGGWAVSKVANRRR